ncbi:hypothetical protein, partial [Roseiconus lacunae]
TRERVARNLTLKLTVRFAFFLVGFFVPLAFFRFSDSYVLSDPSHWINTGTLEFYWLTSLLVYVLPVVLTLCELDPLRQRVKERVDWPAFAYSIVTVAYFGLVLLAFPPLYESLFGRDPLFSNPPPNVWSSTQLGPAVRFLGLVFAISITISAFTLSVDRDWKRAMS